MRDRRKHASPNAAQTESVCAGALRIRLAGDAVYFGKVYKKEFIGDDLRPIDPEDIIKAGRLMYVTALLMMFVFGGIKLYSSCDLLPDFRQIRQKKETEYAIYTWRRYIYIWRDD